MQEEPIRTETRVSPVNSPEEDREVEAVEEEEGLREGELRPTEAGPTGPSLPSSYKEADCRENREGANISSHRSHSNIYSLNLNTISSHSSIPINSRDKLESNITSSRATMETREMATEGRSRPSSLRL